MHVDPTGKVLTVRRERDPMPSLAAESLKSLSRWTLRPRAGPDSRSTPGAPFASTSTVEVDEPKITQMP